METEATPDPPVDRAPVLEASLRLRAPLGGVARLLVDAGVRVAWTDRVQYFWGFDIGCAFTCPVDAGDGDCCAEADPIVVEVPG